MRIRIFLGLLGVTLAALAERPCLDYPLQQIGAGWSSDFKLRCAVGASIMGCVGGLYKQYQYKKHISSIKRSANAINQALKPFNAIVLESNEDASLPAPYSAGLDNQPSINLDDLLEQAQKTKKECDKQLQNIAQHCDALKAFNSYFFNSYAPISSLSTLQRSLNQRILSIDYLITLYQHMKLPEPEFSEKQLHKADSVVEMVEHFIDQKVSSAFSGMGDQQCDEAVETINFQNDNPLNSELIKGLYPQARYPLIDCYKTLEEKWIAYEKVELKRCYLFLSDNVSCQRFFYFNGGQEIFLTKNSYAGYIDKKRTMLKKTQHALFALTYYEFLKLRSEIPESLLRAGKFKQSFKFDESTPEAISDFMQKNQKDIQIYLQDCDAILFAIKNMKKLLDDFPEEGPWKPKKKELRKTYKAYDSKHVYDEINLKKLLLRINLANNRQKGLITHDYTKNIMRAIQVSHVKKG